MDSKQQIEVKGAVFTTLSQSFLQQNKKMTARVMTLSFIIGVLIVGGAVWYIGGLDWLIPSTPTPDVASTAAELVRRLGAVVMTIFLVRIFVPLMRYAAELEIFYSSRAALLDMLAGAAGKDGTVRINVQTLVDVVSADKVRLDAAPDSPMAELMATAKVADKTAPS